MSPRILAAMSVFLALLAPALASAQASKSEGWPAKPVRIVVGFSPGGTTDILARELAARLQEAWGRSVIVDNRPGASGNIGAEVVAKAPPDGYTLFLASNSFAINPALYSTKMPFDTLRDFVPVTHVGSVTNVFVAHPSVPAKTIRELVALARARPAQVTYGSAGVGTSPHLAMELFKSLAHIDLVHVPYKGVPPIVSALLGGEIDVGSASLPSAGIPEHILSGRLRGLALTGARRSARVPQVPTMAESGYPGFDVVIWFGLLAPTGTPQDVVAKLNAETVRIFELPSVRKRLATEDIELRTTTPADFQTYIRSEVALWSKIVKQAGVRLE